jgi:threonine/homoserine/homoserine lactone efflux protein
MLLTPGPHTLFVTATSAVTGKSSTASVTFNIIPFSSTQRIQP